MDKSADAFRTISEVAVDLAIPQHVLRFWETRFPQVKPLKRAGGRRYYRPADVELLRRIRRLLYAEGYTIKGVQRRFKERGGRRESANGRMAEHGVAPLAPGPPDDPSCDPLGEPRADPTDAPASDDVAALRDALAAVTECERILAALRRAPS